MSENKGPIARFQAGNISVSVWENEAKEGRQFKNISIQKNYKVGDQWKSTNSLNVNEIPKAILALQKAYEHLALKDEMALSAVR